MEAISMEREYPKQPMVGVGMVVKDNDRILLVKRKRDPGRGRWSIPGGLLELGERVRDGAKREVKEETGLETEIDGLIDVEENISCDENGKIRFHYVLVDFLGHPISGNLEPATDAEEARWIYLSEIDELQVTNTLKRLLMKMNSKHVFDEMR